ncbi:zinc finger protein 90-like isoform X3 [Ochlerotatus camptorhynchus]|uniref:zinc finger protein 90-like isoform X3 n=1 Tax=Ochlerotatus camptorhynchus TaxID=644619 RepID=UPI0031DDEB3C
MIEKTRPLACEICGIKFSSKGLLLRHKFMKHTKPRYECVNCAKKFYCIRLYKRHSTVCDSVQSDLPSNKSSDELILKDSGDLKVTEENRSNEAPCAKCSHCGIEESSAVALARHILIHHESVACDFCGITWPSLSQAQHHRKTMHKESKLKCPHCSKRFPRRTSLQCHVSQCEKGKFPCEFCGKMFKNVFAVNKHRRAVCREFKRSKKQTQQKTETPPQVESAKCYYCNEEFSSPGRLSHHLKIVHELTKCDICGITILGISATKNHKIKCHFEPKYECPTCGKKFHRKIQYDAHCFECEDKKYACKLCGHMLKKFYSLKEHNRRRHPDESSLENFKIVQVQKQETEKPSQPLAGNPSNQPYLCNICGITFSKNRQINYHMLAKHTEAKFQCPHCLRKFRIKGTCQDHTSSCADLKHSCELCGQKFHLLSGVESHKKQDHSGDSALRNANIEGATVTEERKQYSVEKIAATHTDVMIVPQGENIDLELNIKVEETMLQEQEYHADPGRTFATTLHPHDGISKEIKVKEEYLEDEDEILTEHQTSTESSECRGIPSDRNELRFWKETKFEVSHARMSYRSMT